MCAVLLRLTDNKFYTVGHDADSLVWKMMIMPNTKNLCSKPYRSSISQVTRLGWFIVLISNCILTLSALF